MARWTAVLIHGAGGGSWEYDLYQPVFARAGIRVIARDLVPVSGGLEKTTFEDYVAQVRSWVPASGPVVLIGASMGGILALKAAEKVRPAALVLINSIPPAGVGPVNKTPPYPSVIPWSKGTLDDSRSAMRDCDEATIQKAFRRWRDESGTVMNTLTTKVPATKPSGPTLVVIGNADMDVRPSTSQSLAEWASADIHLYAGMSHVGPLLGRRAPEVAEAIVQWLKNR